MDEPRHPEVPTGRHAIVFAYNFAITTFENNKFLAS